VFLEKLLLIQLVNESPASVGAKLHYRFHCGPCTEFRPPFRVLHL